MLYSIRLLGLLSMAVLLPLAQLPGLAEPHKPGPPTVRTLKADGVAEAEQLMQQGFEYLYTSQLAAASTAFQTAAARYQAANHPGGAAAALLGLSETVVWQGQYTTSLELAEQGLALYQQLGDRTGEAEALHRIGRAYLDLENNELALHYFEQALALRQAVNDPRGEAWTLGLIGIAQIKLGQVNQGLETVETALTTLQTPTDHPLGQLQQQFRQGVLWAWVGNAHRQLGAPELATEALQQALDIGQTIGNRAVEALALVIRGALVQEQGQFETALEHYQQALTAVQKLGNVSLQSAVLLQIGISHASQGHYDQALAAYQQALTASESIADEEGQANALFASLIAIADTHVQKSQALNSQASHLLKSDPQAAKTAANRSAEASREALGYAQQALQVAQANRHEEWLAQANLWMAIAHIAVGQAYEKEGMAWMALNELKAQLESYQRALPFFEAGLPFALATGNETIGSLAYRTIIGSHNGIGVVYNSLGLHEEAIQSTLKALELARQINNFELELHALSSLGDPHINLSREYQATERFEDAIAVIETGIAYTQERLALSESLASEADRQESREQAFQRLWVLELQRQNIYSNQNLYAEALDAAYKSLEIAQQLRQSPVNAIGTSLKVIAGNYLDSNQYAKALTAYGNLYDFAVEVGDFSDQALSLMLMGQVYQNQSLYPEALDKYKQALEVAASHNLIQHRVNALGGLSTLYRVQGKYDLALDQLQTSLAVMRETRNRLEVATTPELLNEVCYLGFAPLSSGDRYSESDFLADNLALINYQQSLDHQRLESTRAGCIESTWHTEGAILHAMGSIARSQGRYLEALDYYQKSLAIDEKIEAGEGSMAPTLHAIGEVYRSQGNYAAALDLYEQVLEIHLRRNDQVGQAVLLNSIGMIYDNRAQYAEALDYYQRALALAEALGRQSLQNSIAYNIGLSSTIQGNFQAVLDTYYQALEVDRRLGHRADEAIILNGIGAVYYSQGRLEQALAAYQEARAIAKDIGARPLEIQSINGLGDIAEVRGEYAAALAYYQEALARAEEIGSQASISSALLNLGYIQVRLGQYSEALSLYQQSLAIDQANGSRGNEAATLSNIAGVYRRQQQHDQALAYSQQALAIHRETGHLVGEIRALDSMGFAYESMGDFQRALAVYQEALALVNTTEARFLESSILNGLGVTYAKLGDADQAFESLEAALALHRDIGNPAGEAAVLADMAQVLAAGGQPEIAIAFYKQAINLREALRSGLQVLPQALQQSYTDSIAETYRKFADLLITQGRLGEAQQVLELLKLEELREAQPGNRAAWTGDGLVLAPIEQEIIDAHGSLIAFGQKIYACQQTRCDELNALREQRSALTLEYTQQVQAFEATIRENRATDEIFTNPSNLSGAARNLVQAQPGSILIYPLVLENKLWLLWTAAGDVVGSIAVEEVDQLTLGRTVVEFRELLQTPDMASLPRLQAKGQQLYDWLIKPLEAELQKNNIQTIIFAQDRITRYLPMAALYDGERYLIERFGVSTVLSAGLTDTRDRITQVTDAPILGLGLTSEVPGFSPLPHVVPELDGVIQAAGWNDRGIYPGSIFLDQAFDRSSLFNNVFDHRILHIATHAKFEPGQPDASFLVLGTGEQLGLTEIDANGAELQNLHLVVLSACETALGGPRADGVEIASISAKFIDSGRARSVLASLWAVNDASTSYLMQLFYEAWASGDGAKTVTKTEALRQAQLALLHNSSALATAIARGDVQVISGRTPARDPITYAHPYYWAPFILIGNGL
jgi:CHAT domain-containing protein